jgi:hypothetical protein
MRLTDILGEVEKLRGEDIHTLLLWAVDAEFTPLVLETRLGKDNLVIHFKPVSYRKVVRFYTAQELYSRSQIYARLYLQVPFREIFYDLLYDGISSIKLNDELRSHDFIRNHPTLERTVTRIVTIVNGLDPAITPEFQRQLKLLEDIAYAYFAEVKVAPPWASILILSYQIFKEGGIWSKPTPIDEPYLLWQAWLSIARGEKRYYDTKYSSSSSASAISLSSEISATTSTSAPVQAVSSLRDAIDVDGLMQVLKELEAGK